MGNSLYTFLATSSVFIILYRKWSLGEKLDLSQVYALFACIFVLNITVNALTYLGIVALSNSSAALQRFSSLYCLPEKPVNQVDEAKPKGVTIKQASFSWKAQGPATIEDIDLECKAGELVVCIGSVGSGKTTFLNSILRETAQLGGTLDINGSTAYVEQEPFIFSASVQENICMGRPFDAKRFAFAVEVA